MTTVQKILCGLFVVSIAVAYWPQIVAVVKRLLASLSVSAPVAEQSVALRVVHDITAVTKLRDKLAAENCPEGVEACTNLLRVIVEHQVPAKGAV